MDHYLEHARQRITAKIHSRSHTGPDILLFLAHVTIQFVSIVPNSFFFLLPFRSFLFPVLLFSFGRRPIPTPSSGHGSWLSNALSHKSLAALLIEQWPIFSFAPLFLLLLRRWNPDLSVRQGCRPIGLVAHKRPRYFPFPLFFSFLFFLTLSTPFPLH